MIKEYIIRVDHKKHEKKIIKACNKICKDFDGEYYTRIVDKNYRAGAIQVVPKPPGGSGGLIWDKGQR